MLYLLDANVLIDANNRYYSRDRFPEFWEWLLDNARKEKVRIPKIIYEEVLKGKGDDLTEWLKQNKETFCRQSGERKTGSLFDWGMHGPPRGRPYA